MGTFIVIESSDAAGGSTQAALLVKKLKKNGFAPHQYHFPQEDSPTGEMIYKKFLQVKNKGNLSRREQALLYIQDFFAKSDEFFRILRKGKKQVIVSDRYCTSTMAYQTAGLSGVSRKKMLDWIEWLVWKDSPQLPKPDVIIFIDIPVAVALKRLEGTKTDYHEKKVPLTRFRRSYLQLARQQRWNIISAVDEGEREKTRQEIHQEIWEAVESSLK